MWEISDNALDNYYRKNYYGAAHCDVAPEYETEDDLMEVEEDEDFI